MLQWRTDSNTVVTHVQKKSLTTSKGVIRMRKSKYRQNTMVKRKKDKKRNNDLENITQKTDD